MQLTPLLVLALSAPVAAAAQAGSVAEPIEWVACPGTSASPGARECALVALPLDHDDPDGPRMDVAVARSRGESASATLWYLDGGPGDAGTAALDRLREVFPDPDLDIYTFDHRGTGGSDRLGCPEQESEDSLDGREIAAAEWPACVESLRRDRDDLAYLTAGQTARDLRDLIAATREPGRRVIVFGASYGTYLANRYLQLAPDQADGVILDGIVPPDWTFAEFDAGLARTARRLMERCAEQPRCAEHFTEGPIAVAEALAAKFDAGHCPDLGVDGSTVRLIFGNMLMAGPDVWPYIPALVFRLDRCWLRDQIATGELVARLFESGTAGAEPESHSPALQRHVALSEMWPDPSPSAADLEGVAATAAMTTAVSASFATTAEIWPTYQRPPHAAEPAGYEGPLLMLHGGLDPTMPVERLSALRGHFSGPSQTFVLFPDAGHVTLNGNACARALYRAFVASPRDVLDASCAGEHAGLDLGGIPADNESLFGTADHWGDRPSSLEWLLWGAVAAVAAAIGATAMLWRRRRRSRKAKAPRASPEA